MKKTLIITIVTCLFASTCLFLNNLYAKNSESRNQGNSYRNSVGAPINKENGKEFQEKYKLEQGDQDVFKKTKQLRDENPEQFKPINHGQPQKIQEWIKSLKYNNPEADKQLKEKRRSRKMQSREQIQLLRNEDHEKLQNMFKNRKAAMQKSMQYLREHNPEEFERVKARIRKNRFENLKKLKQDNPEMFNAAMEKRRAHFNWRLEQLKQENPEKYNRIMSRLKDVKEYDKLRRNNPDKARAYLETKPELMKMIEKNKFGTMHD
ncbi:MAG: hypothetical protein V1747_02450 [Candidatus Omnitrophota bacterium]